ncbi:hypothetical protein GOBAR_AA28644 [Gossypium barbadense]|uniref:Uncharacterized protein n=1 Tax=Gossypium barbadense TaxID=3634 RepID=A0A2P5WLV7_GOSBA|nr:hypothetical protein GOBAR_AA28644 [Gossypium barbadense]
MRVGVGLPLSPLVCHSSVEKPGGAIFVKGGRTFPTMALFIANKIMQKTGYDLENPVGLKTGKGLDEGTKEYIKRRGGYPLSDVRPGVHPRLWNERWVRI